MQKNKLMPNLLTVQSIRPRKSRFYRQFKVTDLNRNNELSTGYIKSGNSAKCS